MNILTFAASNSRNSINRALIGYAATRLRTDIRPDAGIECLDLNDYEMPIYSIDREMEGGIPDRARQFFGKIGEADAVVVSFAEHNGSVTSAWKNIFDWMSRIDMQLWQGKPLVLLAATPGARAGASVLGSQETTAPFFGGDVRGTLGIGNWGEAWDADARTLTRAEDISALEAALGGLPTADAVAKAA